MWSWHCCIVTEAAACDATSGEHQFECWLLHFWFSPLLCTWKQNKTKNSERFPESLGPCIHTGRPRRSTCVSSGPALTFATRHRVNHQMNDFCLALSPILPSKYICVQFHWSTVLSFQVIRFPFKHENVTVTSVMTAWQKQDRAQHSHPNNLKST